MSKHYARARVSTLLTSVLMSFLFLLYQQLHHKPDLTVKFFVQGGADVFIGVDRLKNMSFKDSAFFTKSPHSYPDLPRSPVQHIVFIKTHKCASSTVQNILMRYGSEHQLQLALPLANTNHLGWPNPFDPVRHMRQSQSKPDILCYHSVLSPKTIEAMYEDSFYFTILRDPFTQFKSRYVGFDWPSKCARGLSLTELVESVMLSPQIYKLRCGLSPLINPNLFDLGMSPVDTLDSAIVDNYIKYIDQRFDLVMITEHFYESVIILRDMLGWTNHNVMSFTLNFRKQDDKVGNYSKQREPNNIIDNPENRRRINLILAGDSKLYQYFRDKLEKIISDNKDYIQVEVEKLKVLQNLWMKFCVEKAIPSYLIKDQRFKPSGGGAYGYVLTQEGLLNRTCVELAMKEMAFVGQFHHAATASNQTT